ncbi:MAG: hypothetical protein ACOWWM_00620 [Desulfobacterales bacterium]
MKKYTMADLNDVKTYSIRTRNNKVDIESHFAGRIEPDMSIGKFFDIMPRLLAANRLREVVDAIVQARKIGKPVVMAIGGHVIKCGLQPVLKQLIEADVLTAVAMNGSAAIHDFEISLVGGTSEDVGAVLHAGHFGFADETGKGINRALKEGIEKGIGFGEAVGRRILADRHPYAEYSLLAACVENGIPATVHVAIGTDIVHQHPEADGAAIGEMSYRDFRLLASVVADLGDGGVWLNVGSAVIMPEVFLKALSIARNLGHGVDAVTTVNFDMIQHYRPLQNVIMRPTSSKGKGFAITGHHEINIPLLACAVLDRINAVA